MKYLYSKYEHYLKFIEEHKTNRLCKNLKLMANSKSGDLIKEIFTSPVITDYKIEKYIPNLLISFYTSNKFKYRLDIFRVIEEDKSKSKFINHLAFSDYENDPDDENAYEQLLDRHEMIEILNRIYYILKSLISDSTINNYFCIGGTKLLEKNKIYEYMLKVLVGDYGFKKLPTKIYKTNFGLYFSI